MSLGGPTGLDPGPGRAEGSAKGLRCLGLKQGIAFSTVFASDLRAHHIGPELCILRGLRRRPGPGVARVSRHGHRMVLGMGHAHGCGTMLALAVVLA